jgi:endonuclease/exonuclease/phosphatase family metal-dependent hydrolase
MKKFFRALLVLITIGTGVVYLLSCLTPYISPTRFWPMTFVALGFPFLVIALLILMVIWFFINRKMGVVLLVLFFMGCKNLSATWGVHLFSKFNYDKDTTALRILSWNVRYFDNNVRAADNPDSSRRKMFDFIKSLNADIICFQDYMDYHSPLFFSNIETLRDSLGYKYCFTSKDFTSIYSYGITQSGCAIFSRLPVTDTGKIVYGDISPESVAYADIIFRNKKMRVFTTHLISMGIRPHPGIRNEPGVQKLDSAYRFTEKVSRTLKQYDQIHVQQAEFVKEVLAKSPYPSIITGDFNSVPSSYVYHDIKGNRQDAFLQKGFGLGHSYYALSKTLRIDYILPDNSFKVLQVTTPQLHLSDHFPVVADITWAK